MGCSLVRETEVRRNWRWLLLVPWIVLLGICVFQWRANEAISSRQQNTAGVITSCPPSSHNSYEYTFSVANVEYNGVSNTLDRRASVGDHVIVYFDPDAPHNNSLGSFSTVSRKWLMVIPLPFAFGLIAGFIIFKR